MNSKKPESRRRFLGSILGGATAMVAGPLMIKPIPEVMAEEPTFEINYDPPQDLSHLPTGVHQPCVSG